MRAELVEASQVVPFDRLRAHWAGSGHIGQAQGTFEKLRTHSRSSGRICGGLVRLTVRAGHDNCVAVRVLYPDLPMTWTVAPTFRRVAVRRSHDGCLELVSAYHDLVKSGNFAKPQQDSIANLEIRAHEKAMVVLNLSLMELKDECFVGEQPFVLRTSMIATEAQELLVPEARRFHIAYRDHGLGLSCAHPYHHADAVARRIIYLGQPPLSAIESRPAAYLAAIRLDLPERAVEAIGRDPRDRTTAGRRDIGSQLTDETRCFEASPARIDGPAKDLCVKGS